MNDARSQAELYREVVRAHARDPRYAGSLSEPTARAVASNANCGDRIDVTVRINKQGCLREIGHSTDGCLLCTASASLMAMHTVGLSRENACALCDRMRALTAGDRDVDVREDLRALAGVAAFPSRVPCVLLPWEALANALAGC
jgi:nitrogen fixation protein NifU and related proteins